jgi:hypothetical protein
LIRNHSQRDFNFGFRLRLFASGQKCCRKKVTRLGITWILVDGQSQPLLQFAQWQKAAGERVPLPGFKSTGSAAISFMAAPAAYRG